MIETVWENTNNKKVEYALNKNNSNQLNFSNLIKKNEEIKKFYFPKKKELGPKLTNKFINDKNLSKQLTFFKTNHNYEALYLGKNNITDSGFNLLSKQFINDKSIKHFILSHNKIQFNEFAKAGLADLLKINRHIGWLVLNNNEIENKGARNLAIALKENQSIIHLILSNNKISDEGLKNLLNGLESHPKIESLFIANNNLTSLSISYVINFILNNKTIKRIDISNNFLERPENLNQLIRLADSKQIKLIF